MISDKKVQMRFIKQKDHECLKAQINNSPVNPVYSLQLKAFAASVSHIYALR